jgi:U6 snRNA-associated Sm-like protein LSm6
MDNHISATVPAPSDSKDPSAFLSEIIGVSVTVKLNSGIVYRGMLVHLRGNSSLLMQSQGELQSVDGYMNIALEKCQEYVNGQLRRTYGDAFIRGNNGELKQALDNQDGDGLDPAIQLRESNILAVLYISSE